MEEQSKDLRVTNYHVLQNFTLLIKSIVEFKKYIELDIKKLNSLELREIISSFIPEVRPTDMDIPNVLIEVKEEKPRQLLIIENAPEDLSHSITSLEPHTRFNVLLLIIKTSAIDELIKTTPQKVAASGKTLTEVWGASIWTVKIPDEHTFAEAIEGTQLWISHAYNYRGEDLLQIEKYEEAEPFFDRAIMIDPNYASAWNNKGHSLAELHYLCGVR